MVDWIGPMTIAIDLSASRPAYQQIEQQLASGIERGTLAPGDKLAPERELSTTLGVSRMTVRQAYEGLQRRGLVERGVGRRQFVSAREVDEAH
jgi:DNA-binding GntR family transcriptional regulator